MTTECQKPRETPAKCALCSSQHTANYKGCTAFRIFKMRKTTRQTDNNKIQIDKPSHKTIQTILLSTRYELVPHIHRNYMATTIIFKQATLVYN